MWGSARAARILLCDLDAFFASVEQRDRPELCGLPVIVGGRPEARGVVASCSYEARRFGVRSAMPVRRALRLCPQAVLLPVDITRYRRVSEEVCSPFFGDREQTRTARAVHKGPAVARRCRNTISPKSLSAVIGMAFFRLARLKSSSSEIPGSVSATYATSWPRLRSSTTISRSTFRKTGLKKKDADAAVAAVFDSITAALANGEEVKLVGFGSFTPGGDSDDDPAVPGVGGKESVAQKVEACGRGTRGAATCSDKLVGRKVGKPDQLGIGAALMRRPFAFRQPKLKEEGSQNLRGDPRRQGPVVAVVNPRGKDLAPEVLSRLVGGCLCCGGRKSFSSA